MVFFLHQQSADHERLFNFLWLTRLQRGSLYPSCALFISSTDIFSHKSYFCTCHFPPQTYLFLSFCRRLSLCRLGEMCLFASSPEVRWADWYQSLVRAVNMKATASRSAWHKEWKCGEKQLACLAPFKGNKKSGLPKLTDLHILFVWSIQKPKCKNSYLVFYQGLCVSARVPTTWHVLYLSFYINQNTHRSHCWLMSK